MTIKGWRAFRLSTDGRLRACHTDFVFDGPVARTRRPWSALEEESIFVDPVGAVRRMGEQKVIEALRSKPPLALNGFWPAAQPTGFHVWKTRKLGEAYCWEFDFPVLGEVDLFGTVVEHEFGYRAEALRILSLILLDPSANVHVDKLSANHHCEVTPCSSEKRLKSTKSSLTTLTGPAWLQLQQVFQQQYQNFPQGYPTLIGAPSPPPRKGLWSRVRDAALEARDAVLADWALHAVVAIVTGTLGWIVVSCSLVVVTDAACKAAGLGAGVLSVSWQQACKAPPAPTGLPIQLSFGPSGALTPPAG